MNLFQIFFDSLKKSCLLSHTQIVINDVKHTSHRKFRIILPYPFQCSQQENKKNLHILEHFEEVGILFSFLENVRIMNNTYRIYQVCHEHKRNVACITDYTYTKFRMATLFFFVICSFQEISGVLFVSLEISFTEQLATLVHLADFLSWT